MNGSNNSHAPSRKPLRVLHVNGTLNRGGVETWLSQALVRLQRTNYQCDVCTYRFESGPYASLLKEHGCVLHFVPHKFTPLGLYRFFRNFRRLLREGDYDIVHCHGLLLVGFVLATAWSAGVKMRIGHSHSTDRLTDNRFAAFVGVAGLVINRWLARRFSTHGIGCSEEAQVALFGQNWRKEPKYCIVHCGIDLKPFEQPVDRLAVRSELGISPGVKVMGHVSNLGLAKNPRFLIQIAEDVLRHRPDVMVLIVGDGILRADLEQMCRDKGIDSRVIFAGVRSNVPELMRCAMDVYVMPSVHEGLPLVLLEAQAAGLPCLVSTSVSREAGISEQTVHFLPIDKGTAIWRDAILDEFENTSSRGLALPIMKKTDFNISISANRLADLYDSCAS